MSLSSKCREIERLLAERDSRNEARLERERKEKKLKEDLEILKLEIEKTELQIRLANLKK